MWRVEHPDVALPLWATLWENSTSAELRCQVHGVVARFSSHVTPRELSWTAWAHEREMARRGRSCATPVETP
jgi:hypothetical protein